MNYRKISAKIILSLLILLPFFSALPANAAALKVTLKSDYIQIKGGGTANLTVEVTDTTNTPTVGATVTFTATPAACTAPPPKTTNGDGVIDPPAVFTGPATPPTVVCVIKATATKGGDSGTASVTIVVGSEYAPLVPLPGIGSPTSFPAYLIGLYKLALMSIAIFAMMMILYGGFKYMTSAGNPAAISDAKDAIWSAIFGLILALLSWLLLGTVNPELTIVKTPGTSFTPFTAPTSVPALACSWDGTLLQGTCHCINNVAINQTPPYSTCNSACAASNNCLKAKLLLKKVIQRTPYTEQTIDGSSYNTPGTPLITEAISWFTWDIKTNSIMSNGPFKTGCIDGIGAPGNLNKRCDPTEIVPVGIISGNLEYTWFTVPTTNPLCAPTTTPKGVLCPFQYWITDQLDKTATDIIWINIMAPGS